jgi:hypothetical protein
VKDESYGISVTIRPGASKEEIAHELKRARRMIGVKLVEGVMYSRWYAFRIDERPPKPWEYDIHDFYKLPEYQLRLQISAVQSEHITMYEDTMLDYSSMPWSRLSWSAIGEIKRRIRAKLSR